MKEDYKPKKEWQDELPRLKKMVTDSYEYFKPNYDLYDKSMKFLYDTTLTGDEIAVLNMLNKPVIEFNILSAFVDRQLGEFAKQEPSPIVRCKGNKRYPAKLIETLEGHFRYILAHADSKGLQYKTYSDTLGGGFSGFKGTTEYENERSCKQELRVYKNPDPTLVGYDPLAMQPDKSDGRWSFENSPHTIEYLSETFGIPEEELTFTRRMQGFNWSYNVKGEKIAIVCTLFEKKKKKVRLLELADGRTMTQSEYNNFVKNWDLSGQISQKPIVTQKRWTTETTICRWRFVESRVLDYKETNFTSLPHRFVDGHSSPVTNETGAMKYQKTRPYIYNAFGMQKLKNFAGQTLANELENMVQHKFKVALESIPDQYLEAYENIQLMNTLIYNGFRKDDPTTPLPPPEEIQRIPAPPEVMGTFAAADNSMQVILGSYDASLGVNENELSGIAMIEGATQSNATAMPFIKNYLLGLTSILQWCMEMIPKIYLEARHIPIMGKDGSPEHVLINHPEGLDFNYNPDDLEITVEAGVNFQVQKSRSMEVVTKLMQVAPNFQAFMTSPNGMPILFDNLDIYGIDRIKDGYEEWVKEQQMQAQKNPPPPPPEVLRAQIEQQKLQSQQQIEQMKLQSQQQAEQMKMQIEQQKIAQDRYEAQLKAQQDHIDNLIRISELHLKNKDSAMEAARLQLEAKEANDENLVQLEKTKTERMHKGADIALKAHDMKHKHEKENRELEHMIKQDNKPEVQTTTNS